jgi:hypothetical protein
MSKSISEAISDAEGRLVLAGVIAVGAMYLCSQGKVSATELIAILFGEGGLLAIIGKKNGS